MVSVIIPTHNRAELLPRAINSVMAQTYRDLEIIVVSDGSEDNTSDVVQQIAGTDARVKYEEYFPAQGGNVARNLGVSKAQGEYVAFLDDDDEWLPDKLERQLEIMEKEGSGLCYTGANIIYVREKVTYISQPQRSGDLRKTILLDNYVGSTSTVVVQKKLLEQSGVFDTDLRALQDYDLWIRLCQITKVSVLSEPMINYYNYTNKKQVSSSVEKYEDAFSIIETKYKEMLTELDDNQKIERLRCKYTLLANKCLRNGMPPKARTFIRQMYRHGLYKTAVKFHIASLLPYSVVLRLREHI